ncbi:MAG: DUF547 domain-containing protein [Maribacter sp.]
MIKIRLFVLLLVVFVQGITAQDPDMFFNKADAFFKTYITNGKVEYKALHEEPAILADLMELLKGVDVSNVNDYTYQAFWINAYNLQVIQGIVSNYPLKSPLDVDGFFDKNKHQIAGKEVTLNQIENELLRAKFPNEPRFHFVLVCAGLGCPPIIDEAYRPSTLNEQLKTQTEKALNDPKFIRVEGGEVKVSQIFEWYKSDFEKAGGVVNFINSYREPKIPEDNKVSYYPYDWTLNSVH